MLAFYVQFICSMVKQHLLNKRAIMKGQHFLQRKTPLMLQADMSAKGVGAEPLFPNSGFFYYVVKSRESGGPYRFAGIHKLSIFANSLSALLNLCHS